MANTTNDNWDEAAPTLTDERRDGAQEIRVLRGGVGDRLGKEHVDPAAAGVGGEHIKGSAMVYSQAAAPTLKPDGVTALDAADAGRLWHDTDNDKLFMYDGSDWTTEVSPETHTANTLYAHDGTLVDVLTAMKTAGGYENIIAFAELVVYHFAILTADGTGFTLGDIEYKKAGGSFVAIQPGQYLNGHVCSVGGSFILNPGDFIRYVNDVGTHLAEQASTFAFTV